MKTAPLHRHSARVTGSLHRSVHGSVRAQEHGSVHGPARGRMLGRIAPQTLLILVAAVAVGAGLWAGQRIFAPSAAPAPALQATLTYPQPRALAPFELQQSDGTALTAAELEGRWTLVFFGFTHCPDICPTTLSVLAQARGHWAELPQGQQPQVLFVSVDPERDTAQRTGEYAGYFDPGFLAATGSHQQLEPFARSLGMVYMATELPGTSAASAAASASASASADDASTAAPAYTVDHSSSVAILDPQVRLVGVLRPPLDAAVVASDLRALAGAAP